MIVAGKSAPTMNAPTLVLRTLICTSAFAVGTSLVQADTSNWLNFTSSTGQNWSANGSWVGGAIPGTSDPNLVMNFDPTLAGTTSGAGNTVTASFSSINDLGTVQINHLNLTGKSDAGGSRRTVTISGGTLDFRGSNAVITNTTTRTGSVGTVDYLISSGVTLNTDLLIDSTGATSGGITSLTGNVSLAAGNLTLKSSAGSAAITDYNTAGAVLLATGSQISGSGKIIADGGYVNLVGTNAGYTGTVEVRNGTAIIAPTFMTSSNTLSVGANGTVALQNNNYTIAGLSDYSGGGGVVGMVVNNNRNVTIAGSGNHSFSGTLQDRIGVGASGTNSQLSITISKGAGNTQTLSGLNIHSGSNRLTSGILEINSVANGGAATTLSAAAASGATVLQLTSVSGMVVGQVITGQGIATGTTITAIDTLNNTVTLSTGLVSAGTSGWNIRAGTANSLGISTSVASNLLLTAGSTLRYVGTGHSTDRLYTISGGNGTISTIDASGTGALQFTGTGTAAHTNTNSSRTLVLTGTSTANNSLATTLANNGSGLVNVTKNGTGKWILNGTSTYTGATTVNAGTLLINGSLTSAVTTTAGGVGGSGSTTGNVTIGDNAGSHDAWLGGTSNIDTFTTTGSLSLLSDATFAWEINTTFGTADKVIANGISINSSALFSFSDLGNLTGIVVGQTFVILENTGGAAISGTFSNLANNATFELNNVTYQASYFGGTGNDLELTVLSVVPEPSIGVLVGLGAAFLAIRRRYRRI